MKFRILAGMHTEGIGENRAPIIYYGPKKSDDGNPENDFPGDVVDSKCNLLILNKPGSIKFEKVPENTPTTFNGGESFGQSKLPAVATLEKADDGLSTMTVVDLRQLASEEEIEIDATMKKNELVSCIRVARDLS